MNNEISIWNGYPAHGDIQELDRIVESEGLSITASLSETHEEIDVAWGMTSDDSLGESCKVGVSCFDEGLGYR
ncbi:MAG: hypothetical protein K2G53_03790 [Muribaculaceae bacterium]|nr:hypothetical protein [Muribaculaceae bacterium]